MSTEALEFLITSSKSAQQFSACVWDYCSESGNVLQLYKNGGVAANNTLNQIGNDFIITAEETKPILHIWPVNSQEQIKNVRLIVPGPASALAISPDNSYLAVGIGTKLYIWQISSGKLLSVQEKHLLKLTCIRFSANSNYLITASENGTVVTYNFGSLIYLNNSHLVQSEIGQVEPLYCLSDHIKAVTDIHIGNFGLKSRFVTVSLDSTCRMYNLLKGQLLLQVIYSEPITSVVMDVPCWQLFLGSNSGVIQQFNLQNPPRTSSYHSDTDDKQLNFIGHKSRINCLALNFTSKILVSGSDDFYVIVWNVYSRQMLNKIEHKDAVTNLKFIMRNENLFAHNFKQQFVLKELQRTIDLNSKNFVVSVIQDENITFSDDESEISSSEVKEKIASLEEELRMAKTINKKMYALANEKFYKEHAVK